jgi:hypothetical protein
MALPLLASAVFIALLVAWVLEFRHREEVLPALSNRRMVAPFLVVLAATLVAIPIVLWPLASLAQWPQSTQVAWTGAEPADRAAGSVTIGGVEHSAILGWPNGNFWPEVRVERAAGGFRLLTHGGTALIRAGDAYANGEAITLGGGAKQVGRFSVEFARRCFVCPAKLKIARTPVSEPLVIMDAPPAHQARVRVLDSLLIPRINDLRRGGKIDPGMVHALEEWAGTIRVLRPSRRELHLVQDGEPWRAVAIAAPTTVEVLWPRRRLIIRVTDSDGAPRLSFDPPWTRTTSLPPFRGTDSTLSFAREPQMNTNTFLLPLGYGAAEFRHNAALQLSPAGLPRFRDGADLTPPPRRNGPQWLRRGGALAEALQPNRALSRVRVPVVVAGDASRGVLATITMVRDLPTPRALLLALFVAWVALALFVGSIAFGRAHRLRLRDLWTIGGVIVAVWAILLFRVLLAVRFLLAPTAVDDVTVKGLAGTLAALVIVPGMIALAVRLWLHHRPGVPHDPRGSLVTILVAVLLALTAAIELVLMPRQVLPNIVGRFDSWYFDRLLLVVYAIAIAAILSALRETRAVAALWQIPYRVTFEAGREFWRELANVGRASARPDGLKPVVHVWRALQTPALQRPFAIWAGVAILVLIASRFAPEYVRQIVAPFWILGIPALVLLARPIAGAENALRVLDGVTPAAAEPPLADQIAAVVLLLFVPVAVMFGVMGDFGAIYGVMAFWLPLALLLLLTAARRMAAALLLFAVVAVALAYQALLGTYAIAPGMTEHILSRVEVMKHGSSAQEWLLDLEAPSAGDAKAVTAANVRNALVHEWEHMAMVRKGRWTGLGFNRAPAQQSFIRQDTIQYDSVFSFFVAGEHGLIGGLLLLAIFAAPAIVLVMRRSRLRAGEVLALAIAAALLGEAVVHAAMNVSQLWFSGRNLPLLATSSNSDVLRWGLLLGLMCQALLWSSRLKADSLDTAPDSAITRRSIFDPDFGYTVRRRRRMLISVAVVGLGLLVAVVTRDFAWLAFACAIPLTMLLHTREMPALALLPALLAGVLVVRGSVRAIRSSEYDVMTWSRLLKHVDELYDDGTLRFDPGTKRIHFRGTDRPTGASLLEAEVLRFNALPERVRIDGGRESLPPRFFEGLAGPDDYYARLFELWQQHTQRDRRLRPSVFTVNRVLNEGEGAADVTWEVRGNPDFNVVHSFVEDLPEEELQPVAIHGTNGPVRVLGRAWVMGRWVYAPSREAMALGLGWTRDVGEALFRVRRQQRTRAAQLTLDADLQRAAQATAETAGRELFGKLIAESAPSVLPPRVAFTIMRATTGETLAMGAWPRAASGDRWRSRAVSDGARSWRELEAPLSWLGSAAPRAVASRHAVDHNFTAIEMGSAAKPFWATAALTVHPSLDRLLYTRNGDCDRVVENRCYERQMFGAEIGKGWQVAPMPRWIDFSTYLAASDNRYHTRLGMLGFANARGNTIADDGRGLSRSDRESLTASRTPWERYPALADSTGHTRDRAARIANLHQQPMSQRMRDLFGARIGLPPAEGDLRLHLLSFWSGDEHDDLRTSEALEPLANVSPEAVDLRLAGVDSTRELIAILLGGASSRWSNVAAAAAFSSWAMRKPVIAHIVDREGAAVPLPSRRAAYDERATTAARKLRTGLRRVVGDGTALVIRRQLAPLMDRYEVYAKTGTLSTLDPDRPTSRILIVIVAADGNGNARNAITLSFVAERSTPGFATVQAGRFIERYQSELIQLLDREGAAR